MLNDLKNFAKKKTHLSDRQLSVATKLARGAELWCASGIVWWGGAVALGLGAIGLQAAGVAIPVTVGVSTLAFGVVMAGKSVVLQQAFRALHKKGVSALESRAVAQTGPTGPKMRLPVKTEPLSKLAPAKALCRSFNEKISVEKLVTYFHVLRERRSAKLRHATPENSRLR